MSEEIQKRPKNRPLKSVDWTKVNSMLRAHCKGTSIAESLGIHPDTLYLHVQRKFGMTFSAYSQLKKAEGVDMLRLKQFQVAMDGDKAMLIWLGKNYLGQSDRLESTMHLPDIKIETLTPEGIEVIQETLTRLEGRNKDEK